MQTRKVNGHDHSLPSLTGNKTRCIERCGKREWQTHIILRLGNAILILERTALLDRIAKHTRPESSNSNDLSFVCWIVLSRSAVLLKISIAQWRMAIKCRDKGQRKEGRGRCCLGFSRLTESFIAAASSPAIRISAGLIDKHAPRLLRISAAAVVLPLPLSAALPSATVYQGKNFREREFIKPPTRKTSI